MKSGDLAKIESLLGLAQEQDLKIERGLKFLSKLPKNKQLEELNAIEMEAKDFQKIVLRMQKLKGGLKRRTPEHARILSEIELIEDKEVDLHLKFQKLRKQVLGLGDSAVGGGGGGNTKGVLMAAALGMKIGEQGVKKTEEILATLREANDLMDNMQGDILEQRKKLFRIQDQVKTAQSLTNRGKEALKYFANQAAKDVCIKVLVGLIAVMILGMAVMTYQISKERDMIQATPEELAKENLEQMGLEIDEKGKVKMDEDYEGTDGDYYLDNGDEESKARQKKIEDNYNKDKEEKLKKNSEKIKKEGTEKAEESSNKAEDKSAKNSEEKSKEDDTEDSKELLERKLRQRMLRRNREVLIKLHVE